MAHKNLIGGTAYETTGGKCLVGGTGYTIQKGRTLIGGTGYDISFSKPITITITGGGGSTASVTINGITYTTAATITVDAGTEVKIWISTGSEGSASVTLFESEDAYTGTYLARCSATSDGYTKPVSAEDWAYGNPINDVTIYMETYKTEGDYYARATYTDVFVYDPSLDAGNWR